MRRTVQGKGSAWLRKPPCGGKHTGKSLCNGLEWDSGKQGLFLAEVGKAEREREPAGSVPGNGLPGACQKRATLGENENGFHAPGSGPYQGVRGWYADGSVFGRDGD